MHHRLIEMLVESASFYSVVIVILLVFEVRNEVAGVYIEEFAIATRVSTTNSFYLFLPSYYNVSAREWCQQFWSAALQQAMRAQTTPGAKNSSTSSLRFRNHSSSETDSLEMGTGYESDISPRIRLDLDNDLDSLEESTES